MILVKLIALFISLAVAEESPMQNFRPVQIPLESSDKIIIKGFQGDVHIRAVEGDTMRAQGSRPKGDSQFANWNFQVRKKPGQVEVIVKGVSEQEDWNKVRAGKSPHFSLKILAPARPLEVSWHKGKIKVENWNANATIQLTEGDIDIAGGKGASFTQLINGRLTIKNREGAIGTQTYKGTAILTKNKGGLTVDNHSTRYQIKDHTGTAEMRNHSGSLAMSQFSGQVNLFNSSGVVGIDKHKGSVKGDFEGGSLNVKALEMQEFVINSDKAPVTLDLPKEAGAFVSIKSQKGSLWGAPNLMKVKKGRWTELRGRLRGKDKKGQVKIVSKYGNIVLK